MLKVDEECRKQTMKGRKENVAQKLIQSRKKNIKCRNYSVESRKKRFECRMYKVECIKKKIESRKLKVESIM